MAQLETVAKIVRKAFNNRRPSWDGESIKDKQGKVALSFSRY